MLSGESALGLQNGEFSCPVACRVIYGVELPTSVDSARARRRGLLELLERVRGEDRKGPERRNENFFFAGGACVESGDSGPATTGLALGLGLKACARARGEMGERGESELRRVKRLGLDGERERERRSCWRWLKWEPSRR